MHRYCSKSIMGQHFVAKLAQFRETSRYPLIRRDISFTVPEAIAFRRIGERVSVAAASLLQELRVFDVYQGEGVETGRKSVALGLILQDLSRTLTDEEADRVVAGSAGRSAVEFGCQDKRITLMALTKAEMAEASIQSARTEQTRGTRTRRSVLRRSARCVVPG